MARTILFVIKEAGSAAFCVPLWRQWLKNSPCEWHVLADPQALNVIQRSFGDDFALYGEWGEDPDLSDIDLVVSSATNDAFEVAIAQLCTDQARRRIQFIDVSYDTKSRIQRSNPERCVPEQLLVIHENVRKKAVSGGMNPENIKIIGHPVWEETLNHPFLCGARDVVAFAAQPISQILDLNNLGYNEHDVWALLCAAQTENPALIQELIYCPHPSQKNIPQEFQTSTRLLKADENPLEAAGTIISMFTALMVDGVLSGHHVVSVQPNLAREDRCFLSETGLVPLVTSSCPHDLLQALKQPVEISDPFKDSLKNSLQRLQSALLA